MNSDFFDLADRGLGQALEEGLEVAGEYLQTFTSAEKGSGLGAAKFLHGINFYWKEVPDKEEGDTFKDWALRKSNLSLATIQRRICTWEFINEYIPPEHKETFLNNWSVSMFSRGYRVAVKHIPDKHVGNYKYVKCNDIEPADWLALSECIDDSMLIEVLDKVTGKEPNANRISFSLMDNGDLVFYRGKKHYTVIGTLSVGSHSELVLEGIQELLDCLKNANKLKEEK